MKHINQLVACLTGVAALALAQSGSAQNYGTDILHLDSRVIMTAGVEADAAGVVAVSQKAQGKSDHQQLQIELSGLDTNGIYTLGALIGDSTNLVDVAVLEPDSQGDVSINYQSQGNSKSKGKGKGHGDALPSELNPVSDIRGLVLLNTNLEAVISADMSDAQSLQYLVKRNMSAGEVKALLQIHATAQKTQFRLTSSGLLATNSYLLVVNGVIDQTLQADSKGKLAVKSLANPPTNILDLHSLALWDGSSNVVVSTELP
jgi:hypothetical protein